MDRLRPSEVVLFLNRANIVKETTFSRVAPRAKEQRNGVELRFMTADSDFMEA